MSKIRADDLKNSPFDTWAVIETKRAETVKTVPVKIDSKAATRQAIIVALRRQGFTFATRSDWDARSSISSDGPDGITEALPFTTPAIAFPAMPEE